MPAEPGIIFCLRLELEISCFDLFSLSFSSLLQQLIHLLTPWPCFHYGHATVSHTKKQLESYHSVGQKVLLSVRARHRGRNRPRLYCPWFPINSSFETRPQCYCLRHSWPELHDRPAPSRTKRTERSLSLIHRFSSGQGAHSGAIVCSKDQRHLRMMERGSGRYAGRKICKDQQR
jgi:hypothetical protein